MDRIAIVFKEGTEKEACFEAAKKELTEKIGDFSPILLVYESDVDNFVYYSDKLHEAYPNTEVIGVTTCSHLSSVGRGGMGLSLIAVNEGIEVATGEILEISKCPIRYSDRITGALSKLPNKENCVCLEFISAFCYSEELVLDTLKRQLDPYNIPVFGATGGVNDESEAINFVALNGRIYYEGAVFAIIHNKNGRIGLFKENLYKPTIYKFTATDVDSEERKVYEINDEPAVNVMANMCKLSQDELKEKFVDYPLGRIMGNDIYITEPDSVCDDGSLTYHARIYNYTDLVILEHDDYENVKKETEKKVKDSGIKPNFSIVVNYFRRIEYFDELGITDTHTKALEDMLGDYFGIVGYGEQFDFEQMNQTMIICVFE